MDSKEVTNKSEEVSHVDIFERLIKMEEKVDKLCSDTEGIVGAFHAAQGAFTVLEWLAKVAKPILWLAAVGTAVAAILQDYRQH